MDVKYCFADNVYMCPYPSKPGGINGSARISEKPELSAALKQCAALRKQFLPYFTDGRLIGDCVLTRQCANAHVSAYHLDKKMLIIVLRNGNTKSFNFDYDVSCWLSSGNAKLKTYDSYGKPLSEKKAGTKGNLSFDLEHGDFTFVEITL